MNTANWKDEYENMLDDIEYDENTITCGYTVELINDMQFLITDYSVEGRYKV